MTQEKLASIVLGTNDALIEITGVLVGLSFALPNKALVAVSGLVTGVAASFSMAASAFMHARQEKDSQATTVGVYTGISYLVVVILLVSPYFMFGQVREALTATLSVAVIIVLVFSWYSAKLHNKSFFKEFVLMLLMSLGVASITFAFGQILQKLGIAAP